MHSTFEWWTDGVASGESQTRLGYPESRLLTTVKSRHCRQSRRIVQRSKLLPSRWSPIHQTYLSLFSIAPFQAKGKEGNEDDGLKLMTDTQDPSFLLSRQIVLIVLWGYGFVSNDTIGEIEPRPFCSSMVTTRTDGVASGEHQVYLNVIPSHDGRTRRETHSCKAKAKPVSSYIHLPSLAMFSLQSLKMPC